MSHRLRFVVFVYSVIQFVPNAARGEFINVGVLAGSDETGEWAVRRIHNIDRAVVLGGRGSEELVAGVFEWVDLDLLPRLQAHSNRRQGQRFLWDEAARGNRSYAQITRPIPMAADSGQDALDTVFDIKILDRPVAAIAD